jgi:hypothetical protein
MRFYRRSLIVIPAILILALAFAACGNDDDDADGLDSPDPPPAADDGDGAAAETDDGAADAGNGDDTQAPPPAGDAVAVVTVGDLSYEFALEGSTTVDGDTLMGMCVTTFGVVAGHGYATDGSYAEVDFEIPPEDWETSGEGWEPPTIRIEDRERGYYWRSGDAEFFDISPGVAEVTEFRNADNRATGTATFFDFEAHDFTGDPETVEGTFEIQC